MENYEKNSFDDGDF